jgi:succinoglycan biosynthesis transport protein ExoP
MESALQVSLPLQTGLKPWQPARPANGLFEQLQALRRRWRMILLVALLLPAFTALALSRMPARYTATGILLYDPADSAPPGDAPGANINALDQDAITASQGAIISSLPAATTLAARLNLAALPEFNPELQHPAWLIHLAPDWLSLRAKSQPDDVALAVQKALSVNILSDSRVLAVSFTSRDPALAAAGANLAMQLYLEHERSQSFDDLSDAQSWLEGNALKLQTQLDQTETLLAKARAAAGIVPGAQANLTTETASRVTASLVDAQANLAMAQARLASAANGDAAAANAAIAPSLQPLRKEQADLTAQVQSLQDAYGANYPDLVSARTSLAAITLEIAAETGREMQAAQAEVAADRAQVGTLAAALNLARAQSQAEDVESTPIRALEQRADAERSLLGSVTMQADQLAQQSALTKPDARILSEASPPESPSSPHRFVAIAATSVLGICLGLLLAGLMDALDTSFRSGGDLRTELGMACLALVPEVQAPRDAPLTAPFSVFSEQMRALRTELLLRGNEAEAPRVIAITAARPAEGKTTLTVALARAMASSGLRVLAIDGDIRQPSFDAIFYSLGAAGLTDHLAGLASLDEVILQDRLTKLKVVTAGMQGKDALSLFLSPGLPAMLAECRSRYDVVLMDVPPAFALAEARVLARFADTALFCVRWGKTPRRVVRAAMTMLQEAGVSIIGVALTRVNAAQHGRSGFADAEIYQPRYGGYFRS